MKGMIAFSSDAISSDFLLPQHREEEVALFTMVQQQKSDEITSDVSYPSCRGMMLRSYKVEITASTKLGAEAVLLNPSVYTSNVMYGTCCLYSPDCTTQRKHDF